MELMRFGKCSNTFTEEGLKRLIQFFLMNFGIILFMLLLAFILIIGASNGSLSGVIYKIISSWVITAAIWIIEILIIVWLFWAFTDMVLGQEEFDKQHKISIIIASALLIPSILYTRNNHRSNYCCCYTGLPFMMNYSITLKFQA